MPSDQLTDRELDAAVAEKVMGWVPLPMVPTHDFGPKSRAHRVPEGLERAANGIVTCSIPHYSTNHNAAFAVVGKMRERGWSWQIRSHANEHVTRKVVHFVAPGLGIHRAEDDSAPRAICLAALKALGAPQ